jgi:hypothetical protein
MSGDTKVVLDNEVLDIGGDFDATTNYRFTAPVDGIYSFTAGVRWTDVNLDATFTAAIKLNGTKIVEAGDRSSNNAADPAVNLAVVYKLTTGQYVELFAQTSDDSPLRSDSGVSVFMSGTLIQRT